MQAAYSVVVRACTALATIVQNPPSVPLTYPKYPFDRANRTRYVSLQIARIYPCSSKSSQSACYIYPPDLLLELCIRSQIETSFGDILEQVWDAGTLPA